MTAKEEVEALLKKAKWSRWMLADRAGVPTSTVSRILDKGMDPRHSTMEKLRAAVRSKARK
jgi:predicted transcriptional regulator